MSIQVRLTVDDEGMRRRFEAVPGAVQRAAAAVVVELENLVERDVGRHSKNGAIERSIFKRRIEGGWELGHDLQVAPHARWVHDGARPHVIRPNRRKALRWPLAAAFAFAKKVNHPGYPGDAWLDRAARQAPQLFARQVLAYIGQLNP